MWRQIKQYGWILGTLLTPFLMVGVNAESVIFSQPNANNYELTYNLNSYSSNFYWLNGLYSISSTTVPITRIRVPIEVLVASSTSLHWPMIHFIPVYIDGVNLHTTSTFFQPENVAWLPGNWVSGATTTYNQGITIIDLYPYIGGERTEAMYVEHAQSYIIIMRSDNYTEVAPFTFGNWTPTNSQIEVFSNYQWKSVFNQPLYEILMTEQNYPTIIMYTNTTSPVFEVSHDFSTMPEDLNCIDYAESGFFWSVSKSSL